MNTKHLAAYLNDHLAGSELAIELLNHLIDTFPDSAASKVAEPIREEVISDRKELESIMTALRIHQSTVRKGSAWVSEKFARLKLLVDDVGAGEFRRMETTELISLGIEGKRASGWSLRRSHRTLRN